MKIKAIVFDYDGTLSNGRLFDYLNLKHFFKNYFNDLSDIEFEAVIQDLNKSDIYSCGPQYFRYRCHQYLEKYNITEEMCDELEKYWEEESYKFASLRYNAMDVVLKLKEKYKIGILTNGGKDRQYNKIEKCGLKEVIDGMAVSGEIGVRKPHPKMYQTICERLDVKSEECVFIGDSYSGDILGAYRYNMIPIWYTFDPDTPGGSTIRKISDLEQLFSVLEEIEAEE